VGAVAGVLVALRRPVDANHSVGSPAATVTAGAS